MTAQTGELLVRGGNRVWMQTLPLEAFWEANPPRPYLLAEDSRIVQKKNRHSSGCDPMVVAEHCAEALWALNRVMG
jgi:hypothetical protein